MCGWDELNYKYLTKVIENEERKRTNNILNELEKYVKESLILAKEQETEDTISYVEDILDKIKELKEK